MSNFHASLLQLSLLLCGFIPPVHALTNGGSVSGTISVPGEEVSYTFPAAAGESIQLSIAGDFGVSIRLYSPDSTQNGVPSSSVLKRNSLAQSGTYTVVVYAFNGQQTGSYVLHFVKAPGANEHGALVNGGIRTGDITPGDLDSYTFILVMRLLVYTIMFVLL